MCCNVCCAVCVGAQIANQLRCDHHELKQMLVTLGRKSAEDADFDDLVINVLDKLQQHMKVHGQPGGKGQYTTCVQVLLGS